MSSPQNSRVELLDSKKFILERRESTILWKTCVPRLLGEKEPSVHAPERLKGPSKFQTGVKDVIDSRNIPHVLRVLMVSRSQQIWLMLVGKQPHFCMTHPLDHLEDKRNVHLYQFHSERVSIFMYSSHYKTVRLRFPRDIGGLSENGTIKIDMNQ